VPQTLAGKRANYIRPKRDATGCDLISRWWGGWLAGCGTRGAELAAAAPRWGHLERLAEDHLRVEATRLVGVAQVRVATHEERIDLVRPVGRVHGGLEDRVQEDRAQQDEPPHLLLSAEWRRLQVMPPLALVPPLKTAGLCVLAAGLCVRLLPAALPGLLCAVKRA
jgi:hypothetical protein